MFKMMMHKKILQDTLVESQISSQTSHRIEGLRVLACIIASDLLTKRQDNINKKTDRKVGAQKYWGVTDEGIY